MNGFVLRLESVASGCSPEEVIREMPAVAARLGITIIGNVNGIDVMAWPGRDPDDLVAWWRRRFGEQKP